jgi:GTPase SAR1 family protein
MLTENTSDFENLREKFGRFRILIVGRANAGKTTLLRAICDTTENPKIYDGDGNKVCIQVYACRRVYARPRD